MPKHVRTFVLDATDIKNVKICCKSLNSKYLEITNEPIDSTDLMGDGSCIVSGYIDVKLLKALSFKYKAINYAQEQLKTLKKSKILITIYIVKFTTFYKKKYYANLELMMAKSKGPDYDKFQIGSTAGNSIVDIFQSLSNVFHLKDDAYFYSNSSSIFINTDQAIDNLGNIFF